MNKEYLFYELALRCDKELERMGFKLCVDSGYKDKICLKAINTDAGWSTEVVLEAFESFVEIAAFIRGWHKRQVQHMSEQHTKRKKT